MNLGYTSVTIFLVKPLFVFFCTLFCCVAVLPASLNCVDGGPGSVPPLTVVCLAPGLFD